MIIVVEVSSRGWACIIVVGYIVVVVAVGSPLYAASPKVFSPE